MDEESHLSEIDLRETSLCLQRLLEDSEPDSPGPQRRQFLLDLPRETPALPGSPPRVEDAEEDAASEELLKALARRFESEALQAFAEAKRRLMGDLDAKLESQNLQLTAAIRQLTGKKEKLEFELDQTRSLASKRFRQLSGLVLIFSNLRRSLQETSLLRQSLDAWKQYRVSAYELRVKQRQAGLIERLRSCARIVGAWRAFTHEESLDRKLQAVRADVEATKEDELRQFGQERDALVKEVDFLKLQLKEERENKDSLQDNLKRLFQRNISNLSLEAMTLLHPAGALSFGTDTARAHTTHIPLDLMVGAASPAPSSVIYGERLSATMPTGGQSSLSGLPFVTNYSSELNRSSLSDIGTPKTANGSVSSQRFQRFVPGTVVGRSSAKRDS